MKIYFISGLAADKRVFTHIQLPAHYEPVYLDWITPVKNETLPAYAERLAEKINPHERFSIIGLSFGGMVAVEIARFYKPVQTILISSIPSFKHLPKYFRIASAIKLHKIIPISFLQYAAFLKRLFTNETLEDKKMLRLMIKESDPYFIRWAMDAVLTWRNSDFPENLLHLHGTNDEILPNRFTNPTHLIDKGSHMMVMSRADEVNNILHTILTN